MTQRSAAKDGPVAILAGSGQLPIQLVEHLEKTGQDCRVLAFRGFVSADLRRRADAHVDLLDLKSIMRRARGMAAPRGRPGGRGAATGFLGAARSLFACCATGRK